MWVEAGRSDLMAFLESECKDVGATIVYATHIFDGLEAWPTHLMYLADGKLQVNALPASQPGITAAWCLLVCWQPEPSVHHHHLTPCSTSGLYTWAESSAADRKCLISQWIRHHKENINWVCRGGFHCSSLLLEIM